MKKEEEKALNMHKKESRKIASQLGYHQDVLYTIEAACSIGEIDRAMVDARRKELYNPHFKAKY